MRPLIYHTLLSVNKTTRHALLYDDTHCNVLGHRLYTDVLINLMRQYVHQVRLVTGKKKKSATTVPQTNA
jgi:hypothetical protein